MGVERQGKSRRGTLRLGVVLGSGSMLLAGCASMPESGDVRAVKASPRADSQVRVDAVPPRPGAQPGEIVAGFLEAMTSDDANFATARTYLSAGMAKEWRPEAQTIVLASAPNLGDAIQGPPENPGVDFPLLGQQIAAVDAQHAYQAITPADYRVTIHLSTQNGPEGPEWRIDNLPPGLVLGASDFQRNYLPVNKYYFAAGRNNRVADPIFIRQRMDPVTLMDPVTQSVKALLDGPTNWLKPVVESFFPAGTTLKEGVKSLTIDDRNALKVPLNKKASGVGRPECNKMAAQILFTLKDLSSTRIGQVELQRSDGTQLCVLDSGQQDGYAPDHSAARAGNQYFVDQKSRLALLPDDAKEAPEPVPGALGAGQLPLGPIAVARDETIAAAVAQDARQLFVAPITSIDAPATTLVQSKGKGRDERLSAPSWDGRGDLWVADRDPAHPRLLMSVGGATAPVPVNIAPGLDGARIESLKVSVDGTRIALLLKERGATTLKIGRVERKGPKSAPVVTVADLRPAAPQMETVTSVSWAGPSRLVVVGKEAGGVQQVRYIQTNGFSSPSAVLPGLNSVTAVTASDDEQRPLVALSGDGIVRLPAGSGWQTVVIKGAGSHPVYPG